MTSTMQFVSSPVGGGLELEQNEEEYYTVAQKKQDAVADTRVSKVVFVEGLEKTNNQWYFEIRVESQYSGFIPGLAVGFTMTDPGAEGFEVPRRALEVENALVAGYTGRKPVCGIVAAGYNDHVEVVVDD